MARFFFVETGQWYVDPAVIQVPQAANDKPPCADETDGTCPTQRFHKRIEVKNNMGRTTTCLELRSTSVIT